MKRIILSAVLLLAVSAGAREGSFAQCAAGRIEIPVVFEFQNLQFRTSSVYNTLEPKMSVSDSSQLLTPTSQIVRDGKLELTFCIDADAVPPPNSIFYIYFGPRKLSISARPVTNGRMPVIPYLAQPDPDWVIIRRAKWLVSSNSSPRVEIEIMNFGENTHPGIDLELYMEKTNICGFPGPEPRTETVPVTFSFSKGKLVVASGDPQYQELINRQAEFHYDRCGKSYFKTKLGTTGDLPGRESLRLRYTFDQNQTSRNQNIRRIYQLNQRRIMASGELTFPSIIRVEE